MKFKNQAYEDLVRDLINDTFYLESRSNRGKIATIRQYSEVFIRKLLDLPESEKVTLGDHNIRKKLEIMSLNDPLILESIEKLRELGNKCTHTQNPSIVSDDDVSTAVNMLFNLYASLFILYFKKYEFGSSNLIVSTFSILPPIIRYIVLNNLYNDNKDNIIIIDKLSLVLLKAFDKDIAIEWIDDRKKELSNLLPYTPEAIADIEVAHGKECAETVIANGPDNMYVSCLERLEEVLLVIKRQGLLYNNFEQAMQLYLEKGILDNHTKENRDFNNVMEFVYLGRKVEDNDKINSQHLYNIIV